jgi:uncharacterized protein (TIGR03437 family)
VPIAQGQSTARFRVDAASSLVEGSATITAQLGTGSIQKTLSLEDGGIPRQGSHGVSFAAAVNPGAEPTLEVHSGTPVVVRVVNAASLSEASACSPGAIGRLEGKWLAGDPESDLSGHSTQLSGSVVRIDGVIIPILSASRSRIDFLCPNAVAGSTIEITLQTLTGVALPVQTVMSATAPGIFTLNGSGTEQGVVNYSGTDVTAMIANPENASRAALPGETVTIYATGINPPQKISVMTGTTELKPESIVASTERAGVYEISVTLPNALADGDSEVLLKVLEADGSAIMSNKVSIATTAIDFLQR